MAEDAATRTIIVVTLPDGAGEILEGELPAAKKLAAVLKPGLFAADDQDAIKEVRMFAGKLDGLQPELLLIGLKHALEDEHRAAVHFVHHESGYEMEGVGLEIKDDSVTEEMMFGPMRVIFVSWTRVSTARRGSRAPR